MKRTTLPLIFLLLLISACSSFRDIAPSPTPTSTPIPTATPELMDTSYFLSIINGGFEYSNKEFNETMTGIEVTYEGINKYHPITLKIKVKTRTISSTAGCYSVLGTLIYTLLRDNTASVFPATLEDVIVECYDQNMKLLYRYTFTWDDAIAFAEANEIDASKLIEAPFTPTPRPAPTKTFEEKVEECEKSNLGVRYVITGSNVSSVSITLENDTGGTEQGDFVVPYCSVFTGFRDGDFLYISAQITQGSGSIICKIYDGEKVISQSKASGFAHIATCSTQK